MNVNDMTMIAAAPLYVTNEYLLGILKITISLSPPAYMNITLTFCLEYIYMNIYSISFNN